MPVFKIVNAPLCRLKDCVLIRPIRSFIKDQKPCSLVQPFTGYEVRIVIVRIQ